MRTPTTLLALTLLLPACTGEKSAVKSEQAAPPEPKRSADSRQTSGSEPEEKPAGAPAGGNSKVADERYRAERKKPEAAPRPAEPEALDPETVGQVVTPNFPRAVHEEYEAIREKVKRAEDAYAAYDEDSEDGEKWRAAHAAVSEALERSVRFQEAHPAYPRIAEEVDELRRKSARLEAERP